MTNTIATLTGLSCSGKSHLAAYISQNAQDLSEAVSVTTRPKRSGEVEGVNYYYVTSEEFKAMEDANGLVENVTYGENSYGLSIKEMKRIFAMGKTPISVVEPEGAKEIYAKANEFGISVLNIFIDCPLEVALSRWHTRFMTDIAKGIDNTDFYAKRIALTLKKEILWGSACDYHLILPFAATQNETEIQIQMIRKAIIDCPKRLNTMKVTPEASHEQVIDPIVRLLNSKPSNNEFMRLINRIDPQNKRSISDEFVC